MPNYLPYSNQPERELKPSASGPLSMVYLDPLESKGSGQSEPRGLLEYVRLLRGHRILLLAMLALVFAVDSLSAWARSALAPAHA